ncbi:MAG: phosphonate ABC transporter, permease protein PhnE [Acidimicrobiia bacterium]
MLVLAPAIGLGYIDSVIDGRTGPVGIAEAIAAGPGWLVIGLAFGWVLWRSRPDDLKPGLVVVIAIVWLIAGLAALMWGTSVGYLEELRAAALEAGEIQDLNAKFYGWAGFVAAVIGASVTVSFYVGTPTIAVVGSLLAGSILAWNEVGVNLGEFFTQVGDVGDLAGRFWPPEWTWPKTVGAEPSNVILEPMIETFQIAVFGATIGVVFAVPLAFLASRMTTPNQVVYGASKSFLNVIRTVPDLFWAALFVSAVGFNAFAGALAMLMFSIVIMGKLLSETVDAIDPGPLEAALATGARRSQMIQYAAFPQVLPNYVAYALYIFELNIRASVVIGLVGAGGIGRLLDEQRTFFQWDRVMAIVIVIWVAVVVIEAISVLVRRRLV